MNDDQRDKMLRCLASAFDTAARGCTTQEHAARHIEQRLAAAGFKIEPRKTGAKPELRVVG